MDDSFASFGSACFGALNLGDLRRSRRLATLVDTICRHPGSTLPDKLKDPKDLRAFYRLMNCDDVTHAQLIQGHGDETRRQIAALSPGSVVLQVHDATELDYTSKLSLTDQLGQIGQGTHRGYICQNSLALRADDGAVLGLVSQILHHRANVPKGETVKQKRERTNRESRLWVQGVEASGTAPKGIMCVDVSDSLSDTFEYLAYEITHQRSFVVRSREERRLQVPLAGCDYLYKALEKLPSAGQREVKVLPSTQRKGRLAMLQVSFAQVTVHPPGKRLGEYANEPLRLWVVRTWEDRAPEGEEPLDWILLTNVPVDTLEQAQERIGWYERRWVIEEYHKGMKTGCGIELMQFEKIERLEPAIAVISVVATQLLRMRDAARAPDADKRAATDVIGSEYVEALVGHYRARLKPDVSIKAFYMHVARLGGHQNRKCDGFPGWTTLWRGWMKLEAMVDGYRAARKKMR